jgi:hypothetical protein
METSMLGLSILIQNGDIALYDRACQNLVVDHHCPLFLRRPEGCWQASENRKLGIYTCF